MELFVAVPRSRVFAYLADPRHRPEWQGTLSRVELLDDGPPHVGMRWVDHMRGGASFVLRITELVPDERWAEEGTTGPVRAGVTMLFEDAVREGTAGTRVRLVVRASGQGLARPLGWIGTPLLSLLVRLDLPRLRRAIEAR